MNGIERKLCMLTDRPSGRSPVRATARPGGAVAPGGRRDREPGRSRADLVRVHASRHRARRFVGALMHDARHGRTTDARGACELVEELAATIDEDSGAVLWLTEAGEYDDDYTSIHSVNVCVLTLAYGRHLALARRELIHIGVGALLHDVGKARTPARILQKAGALTPREAAIVQCHPEDGHEIVAAGAPMPQKALDVIRLHHERVGGHGYPFGLSGNEIPRHVRIAAVADAYDTMTSDRPYRRARPADQALRDLHAGASACFDARLVREFTDWVSTCQVWRAPEPGSAAVAAVTTGTGRGRVAAYRRIRRAVTRATAGVDLLQYAG